MQAASIATNRGSIAIVKDSLYAVKFRDAFKTQLVFGVKSSNIVPDGYWSEMV
jgi:hypothetical protein